MTLHETRAPQDQRTIMPPGGSRSRASQDLLPGAHRNYFGPPLELFQCSTGITPRLNGKTSRSYGNTLARHLLGFPALHGKTSTTAGNTSGPHRNYSGATQELLQGGTLGASIWMRSLTRACQRLGPDRHVPVDVNRHHSSLGGPPRLICSDSVSHKFFTLLQSATPTRSCRLRVGLRQGAACNTFATHPSLHESLHSSRLLSDDKQSNTLGLVCLNNWQRQAALDAP